MRKSKDRSCAAPDQAGAITEGRLTIVQAPAPNCRPDWTRLAGLARLALSAARAELEQERLERERDQAEQKGGAA